MTRLAFDVSGERQTAWLRLVGAAVVVVASAGLLVDHPGVVRWLITIGAWLAAAMWLRAFRVTRARIRDAESWYLDLGLDALELREGSRVTRVPWADVTGVDVDEERVVVVVKRANGEAPLVIEPRYRGLSMADLCAQIANAAARPHT